MLKLRLLLCALPTMALVVSACSGSSSSPVTASDACAQAADALCGKYNECSAFYIQVAYGDVDTCKKRALGPCTSALAAPGQSNTPSRTQACASALSGTSCDDLWAGKIPADCVPTAGQVKNGSACGDDSQCASTFCGDGSEVCGSCAVTPKDGDACVNGKCPSGLNCVNNTCVTPGASGAACSTGKPCRANLVCANGTCSNGGKGGDACVPGGASGTPCSFIDGFFCNPTTGKCDTLSTVGSGEACGLVNGKGFICNPTTYCKKDSPTAASGSCAARAQDGAGCSVDETQGPSCLAGAVCSGGVCKIKDPATCK